jgi:hypothetical protein
MRQRNSFFTKNFYQITPQLAIRTDRRLRLSRLSYLSYPIYIVPFILFILPIYPIYIVPFILFILSHLSYLYCPIYPIYIAHLSNLYYPIYIIQFILFILSHLYYLIYITLFILSYKHHIESQLHRDLALEFVTRHEVAILLGLREVKRVVDGELLCDANIKSLGKIPL